MSKIIFTGRPGSGKGTQATLLADQLGIPHISTGDIFRREVQLKTPLGVQITASMAAGQYTSDEITNEVIRKRLAEPDAAGGFILDGYPRTMKQVEFLQTLPIVFDAVVDLHIDAALAVKRLLLRAEEQGREDDNEAVVRSRMDIYDATVTPVIAFYEAEGLVKRFSAVGKIATIQQEILAGITETH